MPITDSRAGATGGPLAPALGEPQRSTKEVAFEPPAYAIADRGTGQPLHGDVGIIGKWATRQWQWRQGFESVIAPKVLRYWQLWRAFDQGPSPGPGQEWRDRTVMPQAFKELATRVPKIVLGLWGLPENFTVRGRHKRSARYEEQVRTLLQETMDEIGLSDPEGELFLKRITDGTYYQQIVGHVWWKVFWRNELSWVKTKMRDTEGKWQPIEMLETLYDNVDLQWLPLSRLAVDLYGKRRWAIEHVQTSLSALEIEDENYKRQHGVHLYPPTAMEDLQLSLMGAQTREGLDEPRDTERWPMDDGAGLMHDPGETPLDLWLCWDNQRRTLTKIVNLRVRLDHGVAPTPDGLDPYIGDPAIPIPGRPYGESVLHWNEGLYTRQTRIVRARMDETLMNLFQQYLVRQNALGSTQWFWRPGGMTTVQQANVDKPISDSIYLVPRRQMPPEAYNEEAHAQQQSESVSGADSVSQGLESTQKSRDVSAAEINQRTLAGATRYQLEVLYHECSFKKPMLQKMLALMRQNLTQPRIVRILDEEEGEPFTLAELMVPVDIVVGGSILDATLAEKLQEIERVTNLLKDPNFALVAKHRELLEELLKATRTLKRKAGMFVKTQEEVDAQQRMAMAGAMGGSAPNAAGMALPPPPPPAEAAGPGGTAGLASLTGSDGGGSPFTPGGAVEII